MRILATKPETEALPDWVLEFLNAGWAPPDDRGQRAAEKYSDDATTAAYQFIPKMNEELRKPGAVIHQFGYSVGGSVTHVEEMKLWPITTYRDKNTKIALALSAAWNDNAPLAECVICGSLIQPDKGRVAITCSPACRMALHRQKKET